MSRQTGPSLHHPIIPRRPFGTIVAFFLAPGLTHVVYQREVAKVAHRILMVVNGIAVALLLLTAVVWVRSEFARDLLVIGDGYSWTLQAATTPGRLHLDVVRPAIPSQTLAWRSSPIRADQPVLLSTQGSGRPKDQGVRSFPFWGVAAAFGAIPLLTFVGGGFQSQRARRRLSRGQCPSCGLSLRGSVYHCPACGYRVPATTLSTRHLGRT